MGLAGWVWLATSLFFFFFWGGGGFEVHEFLDGFASKVDLVAIRLTRCLIYSLNRDDCAYSDLKL